jgi:hypothetical protein
LVEHEGKSVEVEDSETFAERVSMMEVTTVHKDIRLDSQDRGTVVVLMVRTSAVGLSVKLKATRGEGCLMGRDALTMVTVE